MLSGHSYAQSVEEAPPLTIGGVSGLLIDAERGQVIFAKKENEKLRVGLASRLMTVYLSLVNAKPSAMVTASSEAASVADSQLNLRIGEKYSVEALAYAVLLTGAPDASIALAEFVGGSLNGFVDMMNETAGKIGMHSTYFSNPGGQLSEEQLTTAMDIAVFLRAAFAEPRFSNMFGTQAKPWYDARRTTLLTNRNTMFWSFEGTTGGIAGSTDPLLDSIVTSVTRDRMKLISILLEVPKTTSIADSISLFNYGFTNFRYGKLVSAGQTLKTVIVENQALNLLAKADAYYVYPIGDTFVRNFATTIDESKLKPPIRRNLSLGKAVFTLGDKTVIEVELVPEIDIFPQKTIWQVLSERMLASRELLWVIGILISIELLWLAYKIVARLKLRKSKQRGKTRLPF